MAEKVDQEKKQSLFDKFYTMTEDGIKMLKKPIVMRAMKRKLESAYDSCQDILIKSDMEWNDACKDLEGIDVNKLLEIRNARKKAINTKKEIAEMYEEFFSEKISA